MKKVFNMILFLTLPAFCFAQTAEEILNKAADALGGQAAVEGIESMMVMGKIKIPTGQTGEMTVYLKDGGKILVKTKISAPGIDMEVIQGCDGSDCYSTDPMTGARLLEGQEKENMLMQNDFMSEIEWKKLYAKTEYKGEGEVDGKKAHMVYLETKAGMKMTNYYDAESYLVLQSSGESESPMGVMKFDLKNLEFKDIHKGFKIPVKTTVTTMNMTMEMWIEEAEVNIKIPDSKFALPAGLK